MTNFCRLPPESAPGQRLGPGGLDREAVDDLAAVVAGAAGRMRPPPDEAHAVAGGQHRVVGQREVRHRGVAVAFLRHGARPLTPARADRRDAPTRRRRG